MGIFDSIKKSLGGGNKGSEGVKGPSMLLREAGIDPSGLDFSFGGDGTVTISGYVADETTRARIEEVVGGIAQVSAVNNQLVVGAPPAPEPEPAPAATPAPAPADQGLGAALESEGLEAQEHAPVDAAPAEAEAAATTYTVQPGDTLWKISEKHLGSGARYTEIFEANRDILDNPDLIRPGQVLKIP